LLIFTPSGTDFPMVSPAPPAGCSNRQQQSCWAQFNAAVKSLKHQILAVHYAVHDARTPWLAKVIPLFALAYALSPLDLVRASATIRGVVSVWRSIAWPASAMTSGSGSCQGTQQPSGSGSCLFPWIRFLWWLQINDWLQNSITASVLAARGEHGSRSANVWGLEQ